MIVWGRLTAHRGGIYHTRYRPEIEGANSYCIGDHTDLSVNGPFMSFQWSLNGETIAGAVQGTFPASEPGDYSVWVMDSEGCEGDSPLFPVAEVIPGDSDGSGWVTVGEVQQVINMFLGSLLPGIHADCDRDGHISIGEVQKAVNAFLEP